MHSRLYSLIFITILAAIVLAVPTPPAPEVSRIQKRSFKVRRKRNLGFKGYHGPTQLMKAYQKFGVTIPEGLHKSVSDHRINNKVPQGLESRQNAVGIVTATPVAPNDLEYIAPITIGGQTIDMNIDTGSADLWVFNTQLDAQTGIGHTLYDPTKSAGFKLIEGATFNISYGDGSGASGNVGIDTVDIGGATVAGQAIELATSISESFIQDTNSNGLVGLSFSKINTVSPVKQRTFFDNVMPSLAEPVFTADLRRDEVGAYEFGRIDPARFTGDLTWAPIDASNGFWEFSSTKFSVGNGTTFNAFDGIAIADTGTTLMLVNPAIINAYYGQVNGAVNNERIGGIIFPCDSFLPDLHVDIGGAYTATVQGKFINFAQVDEKNCFGGLQQITGRFQIYGDIFFKSQFVAFNGGNHTLGLAPHS